jgi:hypothetical protein
VLLAMPGLVAVFGVLIAAVSVDSVGVVLGERLAATAVLGAVVEGVSGD